MVNISEKKDYLNLLNDTIQNFSFIPNVTSRINKLCNYIIYNISKGNLLEKEFLFVFILLKKEQFQYKEKIYIQNLINNLKKFLKNFSDNSKEIFVINDNILLLELINDNINEGIKNYIKNILTFDFHLGINLNYKNFLSQLISLIIKDDFKILYECIEDLFKNYFKFNKKQRRSILNWIWQTLWADKVLFHKREEVSKFYPILKNILYELIKREKIDEVMIFSMFIFNIQINVIENQEKIYFMLQKEITEPCSRLYEKWIKKHKNEFLNKKSIKNKKKIKIAIVRPHIGYWSPFKVEFSLLKILKNDKKFNEYYKISVFSFDSLELWAGNGDDPKCVNMLKNEGISYISPVKEYNFKQGYYTNYLKKVLEFRKAIINSNISILIYSDHLYSIGEFLFLSRTSPIQIYWSHGNFVYNIKGMDLKISHFKHFGKFENEFKVFTIPLAEEFLKGTEEDKKKGIFIKKQLIEKFGKDTIVLGTIGRLTKINSDEYLSLLSEIMEKHPNTIYLACGAGETGEIEKKIEKYGIDKKRFLFPGFVNPHIYGWVIDIWPDTFPFHQGNSLQEYLHKRGVYVRYYDYEHKLPEFVKKHEELRKLKYSDKFILYIENLSFTYYLQYLEKDPFFADENLVLITNNYHFKDFKKNILYYDFEDLDLIADMTLELKNNQLIFKKNYRFKRKKLVLTNFILMIINKNISLSYTEKEELYRMSMIINGETFSKNEYKILLKEFIANKELCLKIAKFRKIILDKTNELLKKDFLNSFLKIIEDIQ